jgi:hypothetical protein
MEDLYASFVNSLEELWDRIVEYAPNFFGALIVLVIGLIVSNLLGKLAGKIVRLARIDRFSESIGVRDELRVFGENFSFARLAEWIVKWFFYIVTFVMVVDILNIEQLTIFLQTLVLYLPNVLVAIIIMTVGLIVGAMLKSIVENATRGVFASDRYPFFLGSLAKWSIFIFALMAALVQLGVASELVQILFTGFVFMLAIAGGLSFGLGGREHASRVLDKVERDMSSPRRGVRQDTARVTPNARR